MKKEDFVCFIFLTSAVLYVGAHVALALVRPMLPAFAAALARRVDLM